MSKIKSTLTDQANQVGASHGIPTGMLLALALAESNGSAMTIRYEPNFARAKRAPDPSGTYTIDTESMLRMCSLGICQVMGQTARDMAYAGPLTDLFDSEICLDIAATYLNFLHGRANPPRSWRWTLNAYNHGENWEAINPDWMHTGYIEKYQDLLKALSEA
jgi:hypothetical protein